MSVLQTVAGQIVQFCDGCALALAVLGDVPRRAAPRCENDPQKLQTVWGEKLEQYRTYAKAPNSVSSEYDREGEHARRRCIYGAIRLSVEDAEVSKDVGLPTFRCMAFFPSGGRVSSSRVEKLWKVLHQEISLKFDFMPLMERFERKNLVTISRTFPLTIIFWSIFILVGAHHYCD